MLNRRLLAPLVPLIAFWGTSARADSPQINNIVPYGVPRGVPTDVTISGANLGANPRLVTAIPVTVEPPAMPGGDASNWKLKLTVAPSVSIGVYPFRVVTDDGISNPFLLAVGQLPNAAETEPNDTPATAQTLSVPCVIEGQAAGNDADYFKFAGRKGQKILIDALCARIGSGIDPQIRLTTAGGKFVASADDTAGIFTDARMVVELPEEGDYVVELSDTKYQGTGRAVYRLLIGAVPAAEEVYPMGGRRGETVGIELRGGTLPAPGPSIGAVLINTPAPDDLFRPKVTNHMLGQASPSDPTFDVELPMPIEISDYVEIRESTGDTPQLVKALPPVVLNGRIDPAGDEDRFLLAVTPGQVLRIQMHAADLGSSLDGSLRVLNAANNQQIATADDTNVPPSGLRNQPRKAPGTTSPDPTLDVTVPGGVTEIALLIRDLSGRGGVGYAYRVLVEPATPVFAIQLAGEPQASVPKGGTSTIPVSVLRQGFDGPITLSVTNAPPGLTVRTGQIGERQPVGAFSIAASADAAFGPVVLDVIGTGQGPNGPIVEKAGKLVVLAQQQNLPSNVQLQTGLAAAPAPPKVLALDAPADPIEAVHGFPVTIPVKVARNGEAAKGDLSIPPPVMPQGLTTGETKIAAEATEANLTVNVDPGVALGQVSLGFTAKGKFDKKDVVFGVPAITLNVVRPVSAEPEKVQFAIKPGETVEFKGKLVRRGPFKEPVALQINGLPEGLKAEGVTVAPDASEFLIKLVADAGAKEADVKANLAIAPFKVGGKDYNSPAVPLELKVAK